MTLGYDSNLGYDSTEEPASPEGAWGDDFIPMSTQEAFTLLVKFGVDPRDAGKALDAAQNSDNGKYTEGRLHVVSDDDRQCWMIRLVP